MGKTERTSAASRVSKLFAELIKLNDYELFERAKKSWPAIAQATRDECLKYLIVTEIHKQFNTF
jgi:hypothetical protein